MGRGLVRNYGDTRRPEPIAYCDRCNHRWLHKELAWQFDWRGPKLANLRILVCPTCYDQPYEFNRPIVIGPDPVPVKDPRPGYLAQQAGPQPPPFFPFLPFETIAPPSAFRYLTDDLGDVITDDLGQPIQIEGGTSLGPPIPPPLLFQYLTDDLGNVITDDLGNPIEVEAGGGGPTPLPPPGAPGSLVFTDPAHSQYIPVVL